MFWSKAALVPVAKPYKTYNDNTAEMPTPKMVAVCEPTRPMTLPAKPANKEPAKGANAISKYNCASLIFAPLTFQAA